jgi:hypothetical protein
MSFREYFFTPGGSSAKLLVVSEGSIAGRDAIGIVIHLAVGEVIRKVLVAIDPFINPDIVKAPGGQDAVVDPHPRQALAILAVLDALDTDSAFGSNSGNTTLEVNSDRAKTLASKPHPSDRDIRRYLARLVYTVYSNGSLESTVTLDRMDELITGARRIDLERNVGVLMAECYLSDEYQTMGDDSLAATVKLVREVERFGAAKDDVVSERDYAATIDAHPILAVDRTALLHEWTRFGVARTEAELVSVFRALAPLVESILRPVLATHGSKKSDSSLGPMIGDLEARKLGNRAIWSRLNHVVLFGRNLTEHGDSLSEPALRMACENAFDLVPQIAALAI